MNRIHAKGDTKQFLALSSTRMKFHSAEITSSYRLYLWTRLARKKSVITQDPLKSWRDTFLKGKIMCEVATWNASLRRPLPTLEKPKTNQRQLTNICKELIQHICNSCATHSWDHSGSRTSLRSHDKAKALARVYLSARVQRAHSRIDFLASQKWCQKPRNCSQSWYS